MKHFSKFYALLSLTIFFLLCACHRDHPASVASPVTLTCIQIETDKTLSDIVSTPGAVDYIVPCNISVEAKLTIDPGVVIQFATDAGFNIFVTGGSVKAIGTSSQPIVMRGEVDAPGSWMGINFSTNDVLNELSFVTITGAGSRSFDGADVKANIRVGRIAQVKINNCIIEKSGRNGLYSDGVSTTVENPIKSFSNNQFNNNADYPISVPAPSGGIIDAATSFTGNSKQAIEIRDGNIVEDDRWANCQVPFIVNGFASVGYFNNPNGSLTIDPGTTINFGTAAALGIAGGATGYLKIVGTSTQHITLTGEIAAAGSWKGIGISSINPLNEISYADINYGGCCLFSGSNLSKGNIVVGANATGVLKISNTSISNSASCGIRVMTGSTLQNLGGLTYLNNAGGNTCP